MEEMLGQCVLCCVLCHSLGSRVKGGGVKVVLSPAYSSYREVEVRFGSAQLDCFLVTDSTKVPCRSVVEIQYFESHIASTCNV